MKISILISLIILLVGGYFGWERQERTKKLKSEVEELLVQLEEAGISVEEKTEEGSAKLSKRDTREQREEIVNEFANELVALMRKMKEKQKRGESTSGMDEEGLVLVEKMMVLTPNELKMLVKNLRDHPDLDDQSKSEMAMFAVMMLSSQSPETALALMVETNDLLPKQMGGDWLVGQIVGAYAQKDPMAALTWLKENGDQVGGVSDTLRQQVLTGVARQDVGSALAMLADLGFKNVSEGYRTIAMTIASTQDASRYLEELEKGTLEKGQQMNVVASMSNSPLFKDVKTVTEWLDQEGMESYRDGIIQNVGYYQAQDSAVQWLDWLKKQEGDEASKASSNIISGWTRDDFRATGEWLNEQEAGETKDTMVTQYAETLSRHEPAAAAEWAGSLPAGEKRTELFKDIHKRWKKKDAEAAAAFAEKWKIQEN